MIFLGYDGRSYVRRVKAINDLLGLHYSLKPFFKREVCSTFKHLVLLSPIFAGHSRRWPCPSNSLSDQPETLTMERHFVTRALEKWGVSKKLPKGQSS